MTRPRSTGGLCENARTRKPCGRVALISHEVQWNLWRRQLLTSGQSGRSSDEDDVQIGSIGERRRRGSVAHGYMCLSRTAYWQGLASLRKDLLEAGYPAVISYVPRTGDVATRALHLARCLAEMPQRRLILVGHSIRAASTHATWRAASIADDRSVTS